VLELAALESVLLELAVLALAVLVLAVLVLAVLAALAALVEKVHWVEPPRCLLIAPAQCPQPCSSSTHPRHHPDSTQSAQRRGTLRSFGSQHSNPAGLVSSPNRGWGL
jgi:hypothetical protein